MPHTLHPSVHSMLNRTFGLPDESHEPQHTPGPWKVGGADEHWDADPERSRPCHTTQPISSDGRPDPICLVIEDESNGLGTGDPMLSANARLIAAAPDLLSALTELLAAIADPALGPDDGLALEATYRSAVNRRDAAVENARAVLQATGG